MLFKLKLLILVTYNIENLIKTKSLIFHLWRQLDSEQRTCHQFLEICLFHYPFKWWVKSTSIVFVANALFGRLNSCNWIVLDFITYSKVFCCADKNVQYVPHPTKLCQTSFQSQFVLQNIVLSNQLQSCLAKQAPELLFTVLSTSFLCCILNGEQWQIGSFFKILQLNVKGEPSE